MAFGKGIEAAGTLNPLTGEETESSTEPAKAACVPLPAHLEVVMSTEV